MRDTMTFEVYGNNLKDFKRWIKKHYAFSVVSSEKDGGYYNVLVSNKYQFDLWADLKRFYTESIKI
jgi:hypothetical protein